MPLSDDSAAGVGAAIVAGNLECESLADITFTSD